MVVSLPEVQRHWGDGRNRAQKFIHVGVTVIAAPKVSVHTRVTVEAALKGSIHAEVTVAVAPSGKELHELSAFRFSA